jgi:hypothetical protein
MPLIESKIKALIVLILELSNSLMSFVEQLPLRIQITFGGNPQKATRLLKSLSLVTIVNPSALANSQTTESFATSRLRSCKCFEPANVFAKKTVSLGGRFWSNRSFMRRKVQSFLCLQHSSNRQVCLLFPKRESLQVFLQNSFLKRGSSIHQLRLSAFPSRKVYHFFSRVPKLFFHLVTWQHFFVQKYKKNSSINPCQIILYKDFLKWVAIAFVIATPIAWYAMNKWLENFAYKTELSWWIFALAGLLALGIALFTVSWQSWRAATRNPVEALRYE